MKYLILILLAFFINVPNALADCIPDPGDPTVFYDENGDLCTPPASPTATPLPGTPAPDDTTKKFVPLAPIPGLTDVQPDQGGLASFFNNLYKYLIGLSAVLAIIMIIWGGLEYATQDIPGQKQQGKERIQQAILGLVLILSPVLVFSIINPNILNLSINLEKLDTKPGLPVGSTPTGNQSGAPPSAGCRATGGQYLDKAVCASRKDAQGYSCTNGGNLILPSCRKADPNRKCLDEGSLAYCSKSVEVVYQKATHWFGYVPGWSNKVIPRDAQKEQNFIAGCKADGGKIDSTRTWSGEFSVYTRPINPVSALLSGGCPEDSGIVIEDPGTFVRYGVICFGQTLACKP